MLDINKRNQALDLRIDRETTRGKKLKMRAEKLLNKISKRVEIEYNEGYNFSSISYFFNFDLIHFSDLIQEKYPNAISQVLTIANELRIDYIPTLKQREEER